MQYSGELTNYEFLRLPFKHKLKALKRHESREKNDGKVLCAYCQSDLNHQQLNLSHIVPTALGGKTDASNTVLACRDCVASKLDLPLEAWLARLDAQRSSVLQMLNRSRTMTFDELIALSILIEGSPQVTQRWWGFFVRIVQSFAPIDFEITYQPDGSFVVKREEEAYQLAPTLCSGIAYHNP